jgi:hypothetical protein
LLSLQTIPLIGKVSAEGSSTDSNLGLFWETN